MTSREHALWRAAIHEAAHCLALYENPRLVALLRPHTIRVFPNGCGAFYYGGDPSVPIPAAKDREKAEVCDAGVCNAARDFGFTLATLYVEMLLSGPAAEMADAGEIPDKDLRFAQSGHYTLSNDFQKAANTLTQTLDPEGREMPGDAYRRVRPILCRSLIALVTTYPMRREQIETGARAILERGGECPWKDIAAAFAHTTKPPNPTAAPTVGTSIVRTVKTSGLGARLLERVRRLIAAVRCHVGGSTTEGTNEKENEHAIRN
jgi:hypothetical protein